MVLTPFQDISTLFEQAVVGVVQNGTANMIALVSPLMAACFGVYLMLILVSYWKGGSGDPISDMMLRVIGWAIVISFGLNISTYTQYVIPFVNGLGDDLGAVVGNDYNSASALDTLFNALLTAFTSLWSDADGIKETLFAAFAIFVSFVLGGLFMVIACVYIILAKVGLGILLAIGPLFISAAMFPATRGFFHNWVAQWVNYSLLIMLFSFVAQIEIAMITKLAPADLSISALAMLCGTCGVSIFVSLGLPVLAASLAGGLGISTNFRKIPHFKISRFPKLGGESKKGGAMKGAVAMEKKL